MRAESRPSVAALAKLEQQIAEQTHRADGLRRQAAAIDDEVAKLKRSYDSLRVSFGGTPVHAVRRKRRDALSDEEKAERERIVMEPMRTLQGATLGEIARHASGRFGYTTVAKVVSGLVERGVVVRRGERHSGSVYAVALKPVQVAPPDRYSSRDEEIIRPLRSVLASGIGYDAMELVHNLRGRVSGVTKDEVVSVLSKMVSDGSVIAVGALYKLR